MCSVPKFASLVPRHKIMGRPVGNDQHVGSLNFEYDSLTLVDYLTSHALLGSCWCSRS